MSCPSFLVSMIMVLPWFLEINPHIHVLIDTHFLRRMKLDYSIIIGVRVIRPDTSPYSLPEFMVLNKEGNWWTCSNFFVLNKLTIWKTNWASKEIMDLRPPLSLSHPYSTPSCVKGEIDVVNGSKGNRKTVHLELTHSIRYGMELNFSLFYISFELAWEVRSECLLQWCYNFG